MINKVEISNVNTSKLPVLSNEEKQELLVKIKNGDNEAREKVHIKMVELLIEVHFIHFYFCATKLYFFI